MTSTQTSISKWHMKADYVETCNCDFGCPCNFNGFPTNGFCRALTLYHIQAGSFGDVKLDNLDVVTAFSWPKAIHEGNGTVQLFITKNSNEQQRISVITIFSGQAKGVGIRTRDSRISSEMIKVRYSTWLSYGPIFLNSVYRSIFNV